MQKSGIGVLALALLAVAGACSEGVVSRSRLSVPGLYSTADLGMPPGGLADSRAAFEPLFEPNGRTLVGETTAKSSLVTNVEESKSYVVQEKARVKVIAENGDWLRVLALVEVEGRMVVEEGFIPTRDVSFIGSENDGVSANFPDSSDDANEWPKVDEDDEGEIQATLSSRSHPGDNLTLPAGSDSTANSAMGDASGQKPVSDNQSASDGEIQANLQTVVDNNLDAELKGDMDDESDIGVTLSTVTNPGSSSAGASTSTPTPTPAPVTTSAPPAREVEPKCTQVVFKYEKEKNILRCEDGKEATDCKLGGGILRDPADASGESYFLIRGQAAAWKINVEGMYAKNSTGQGIVQDIQKPETKFDATGEETKVELKKVLKSNSLHQGVRRFEFIPKDRQGNNGRKCVLSMQSVSPIVLDLGATGRFVGPSLGQSDARFDLLGNGELLQTSWVSSEMGFLALDLDKDGKISTGRELFGDATRGSSGQVFENGYAALAQYDENSDGLISANDSVFSKLLVWQDLNGNASSEKGELRNLASYGITAISVKFRRSVQQDEPRIGQTEVRWEARYFGPAQCRAQGCLSFDVYFATVQSLAVKD